MSDVDALARTIREALAHGRFVFECEEDATGTGIFDDAYDALDALLAQVAQGGDA